MMKIPDQPSEVHDAALILGNTLRLAILHVLSGGPMSRAEASRRLKVSETNLSRQLTTLQDYGLVTSKTLPGRGRPLEYRVNQDRVELVLQALSSYVRGTGDETQPRR